MKRLLAYLFIVLGLGLIINTSLYSITLAAGKWKVVYKLYPTGPTFSGSSTKKNFADAEAYQKCQGANTHGNASYGQTKPCLVYKITDPNGKVSEHWIESVNKYTETQIAKAEPSKTQKVVSSKPKVYFCVPSDKEVYKYPKNTYFSIYLDQCYSNTISVSQDTFIKKLIESKPENYRVAKFFDSFKAYENYGLDPYLYAYILKKNKFNIVHKDWIKFAKLHEEKLQIAKAEPSQTQEEDAYIKLEMVAKVISDKFLNSDLTSTFFTFSDTNKIALNDKKSINKFYKEVFKKALNKCKKLNKGYYKGVCTITSVKLTDLNNSKNNKLLVNNKGFKNSSSFFDLINDSKTQIAKAEPTITPKKKVEVAKVEETKQEEFKPKNKDIDNDAPVIEIAQNIIVSDTSYVIEGKVSDKSDKIFVEIDGQPIEVRKGKFKAKRYSPVDEQVKIVAIDQWGNKSKPKIVNIKINIEETVVAENLEPLNPSNIRTKSSNEKIAIIIGIENYSEAPKANYANLDAQYFFDYARKAFGVKKQNINLLINENATVVKTDKALSLWLKSKIKKNRSDLIIFFAGHGLASTDGKELYLLPQDGNPDRLERTALSRTDLFREIIELNPRNVTMFLDTCYSGVSRDEQMLLASARPIRIVADEQDGIPDNFTIFSASKLDQISSGLKEAKHGIFSYYLMKGLEGNADSNQDNKITNGELLAYMDENVSQKAAEQGRQQNPSLAGDLNKVLISYR